MNRISFSLIAVIFAFNFLGCDNSDDGPDVNNSNKIKLTGGVKSVSLKSSLGPLNQVFNVDFPIGIYAYNGSWKAGSTNLINNDNAVVEATSPHNVIFASSTGYYYPTDGSVVYFRAFAPQGSQSTESTVGVGPKVDININGHDDVMFASAEGFQIGSASASNPVLNFSHLLTQLQFTLKTDATYISTKAKVVSLKIIDQPSTVTLDVESGHITFGSSGLINMEAVVVNSNTTLGSTALDMESPLMTQPKTSYQLAVDVQPDPDDATKKITYNATITVNAEKGNAHMITLTFTAKGITATATVADWIQGSGGSTTL